MIFRILLDALKNWTRPRWLFAAATAVVVALAIGVPTDVIPNLVFGRQGTPVEPWAVPILTMTAVLSGLLAATYFRPDATVEADDADVLDGASRFGGVGGLVSLFAVGCPICNKLVVIALGRLRCADLVCTHPAVPWSRCAPRRLLSNSR